MLDTRFQMNFRTQEARDKKQKEANTKNAKDLAKTHQAEFDKLEQNLLQQLDTKTENLVAQMDN